MPVELRDLAEAVRATREEFDTAFLAAHRESGVVTPARSFKMLTRNIPIDVDAFQAAFTVASQENWLLHLVQSCINDGLGSLDLFRRVEALKSTGSAGELEALYNQNLVEAHVLARNLPVLIATTCHIVVDQIPMGTGFLVGPDRIISAWHVVRNLFDGDGRPANDGSRRLKIFFDDSPVQIRVEVKVAGDWHIVSSSCHPDELNGGFPADLGLLAGHFDFVVIRLDDDPGRRRGWLRIDPDLEPLPGDTISIFQHPLGNALRFAQGQFDAFVDSPTRTRFLHRAGTAGGSSGAPCFNTRLRLVGVHQGKYEKDAMPRNRAIVAARLAEAIGEPEVPRALSRVADSRPVLGRLNLQHAIGSMASGVAKRILLIQGASKTGKTFSLDILEASLPNAQNVVLRLDAAEIPDRGDNFTRLMLARAGRKAVSLPFEDDPGTSIDAYIKHRLIPTLSEQMEKVLEGRLFWLAIDSLEKHALPMGTTRRLLDLLYDQIGTLPWLRIVLVGFRGMLSDSGRRFVEEDVIDAPTLSDIENYLARETAKVGIRIDIAEMARLTDELARERGGEYVGTLAAVLEEEIEPLLAEFSLRSPA